MAIRFPPADALSGTLIGTELTPLIDEYRATLLRRRTAQEERLAGEAAAPAARKADAQAYADCVRVGKPDPGPVNVVAQEAKVKDAIRRVQGEDALLMRLEGEAHALRRERDDTWSADLHERRSAVLSRATELADALASALLDMSGLDAALAWTKTGRPEVVKPNAILAALASVRTLGTEPVQVVMDHADDADA